MSCQWDGKKCNVAPPKQIESGWGCPLSRSGDKGCQCKNLFDAGYIPTSALTAQSTIFTTNTRNWSWQDTIFLEPEGYENLRTLKSVRNLTFQVPVCQRLSLSSESVFLSKESYLTPFIRHSHTCQNIQSQIRSSNRCPVAHSSFQEITELPANIGT